MLEAEIQHQLKLSNENSAHFDYKILFDQGKISLDVYTYSRTYNDYMLLCGPIVGQTPEEVLENALSFLRTHNVIKQTEKPLVIHWKKKNDLTYNKSYFYDTEDKALEKLFKEKEINEYDYTVEVLPIS